MAKRKIGTVTLVRNCENFILPHLNMLQGVDKRAVLFLKQPFKPYTGYYPPAPDRAIDLVKSYPDVEIYETDIDEYGADVYNAAMETCKECDIVIFFHADVLMVPEEWQKLLDFIQSSNHGCYTLNFSKCATSYYHDFEHGIKDMLDHDPIAVSPKQKFSGILSYPGAHHEIDFIRFHHFVGFKGIASTKDWIDGKVADDSGRWSQDMLKQYGAWTPCPKEIREMFAVNKESGLLVPPVI